VRRRALAGLLTLLLVVSTVLSANVRTAAAAVTEADYQSAARQLNKYGLVQGDDRGYRFYEQITRAELAKLLVYSLGMESEAGRYVGRGAFPDTGGHWAEGIVGVAKTLGFLRGDDRGNFRPQAPLTNAEAITALARMAGLEATSEPWPRTYWNPAVDAGIVPGDMEASLRAGLNDVANRGDVFVLLWRTLTEVKNFEGQNLLRRYLDRTPPTVALDPLPESTGDMLLDITGTVKDAVKVLVNGQPATLTEFGYFSGSVSLRKGPNTIRVQATDDAGNVKEATAQVTRTDSPVGAIALAGPAVVGAGSTATYTMVLRDQNGETMTDRSQVRARVEPADLGTFDPLTGTFTAGKQQGSGQIVVTSGGAMGFAMVTVTAGALDRLVITPAETAVDGSESAQFTVQGYDKGGNEVPVSDVRWSVTGGSISTTGWFTAPATPGKFTVTATSGGRTAQAVVQPPNHRVASVRLTAPSTRLPANGTSELTMTATLLDDKGAVVTEYQGTVIATSSNSGVAEPVSTRVDVTNGVANVVVRSGSEAGSAVITVKTNLGKSAGATVNTTAQRLQSIQLRGVPVPSTGTEPTAYVEAVALDVDGNPMRAPLPRMYVVHLTLNSPTARFVQNGQQQADIALGTIDPQTGDVRTRTMIQYQPGTGTQVILGEVLGENLDWLTVFPGAFQADQLGAPAKLRIEPLVEVDAGEPHTVYVNVLDADGYRVTANLLLSGIQVTLRDSNGVVWPVAAGASGAGPGRIGFSVVQTKAGSYTYTATLQPGFAAATAQGVVVAGDAMQLALKVEPAEPVADNKTRITLRAEVRDSYGNLVTSAYPVTFRRLSNNGALQSFSEQTVYTRNGVAEWQVTAGTVVGRDEVEALVLHPLAPNGRLAAAATVVTRGAPERLAIRYGDNDGDGTAGDPEDHMGRIGRLLTVYVDVLDQFGNVVASDKGRRISLTVQDLSDAGKPPVMTATTADGRATFAITRNGASQYALKAESADLMKGLTAGFGGAVADMQIQPGGTLQVAAVADVITLGAGGGVNYAEVGAQLLDSQKNPTPNQTGRPVVVTLSIPDNSPFTSGYFTVNDAPDGAKTRIRSVVIPAGETVSPVVRFFSGNSGTSQKITAKLPDGTTSAVLTIRSVALATTGYKVAILPVQAAPLQPWDGVAGATDGQTVIVEAQDKNGNRLSDYDGWVTLQVHENDARIVAVRRDKVLTSLDLGGGFYVDGPQQVRADRGRAEFVVRASVPGVKHYEVTAAEGINVPAGSVTATGRFDGVAAERVELEAVPASVRPDARVTLRARLYDGFDAWLPAAGGSVTFTDGAWSSGPVSAVNGVFSAVYTAPATGNVTIQVTSTLPGVGLDSASFIVDGDAPQLTSLTFTPGRVSATAGTVNEGDTITFTFDEAIDGASVLPALRPGVTLTAGLGTIHFDSTTERITFQGLTSLGRLEFAGNAIPTAGNALFHVAALSLDAEGRVLTLRLGALQAGVTNLRVDTSILVNWPSPAVKDEAGNLVEDAPDIAPEGSF
jgi:hypothetical protein